MQKVSFTKSGVDDVVVGMPATYSINGDSYACEVSNVKRTKDGKLKTVTISKHNGAIFEEWSVRRNGRLVPIGKTPVRGESLYIGVANERRDPHF